MQLKMWQVVFGYENGIGHDEWVFRSRKGAEEHIAKIMEWHGPDHNEKFSDLLQQGQIEQARQVFNEIMDDSWIVIYETTVRD